MTTGFFDLPLKVSTLDGRNCILLEDCIYVTSDGQKSYIIPAGSTSDGASTPPEIWLNFPPFGTYWPAAYLHDSAYRGTLLNIDRSKALLPKDDCDKLLLDAMDTLGTHQFTRDAIYEGVAIGGQSSFDSDRKSLPVTPSNPALPQPKTSQPWPPPPFSKPVSPGAPGSPS